MDHGSSATAYQPPIPDPVAVAALRSALLADGPVLDRIAMLPRDEALAALCAFARAQGIALEDEALRHFLRADPLGLDRFDLRAVSGEAPPSRQWLPVGLASDGTQVLVKWAHFGTVPLDGPFFEYSLRKARQHPVSHLFGWRTPLARLAAEAPCLDGLVFHMSRCGSTLVAQALAALSGHLVLSEPAPFDELLQFCAVRVDIALETRIALLRGMAAALASERGAPVRRRFLKTDCWHAGAMPLLHAAFPDTPWVFLYRDPREVLMSHERMPGSQTLPGQHAALVGIDDPAALPGLDFTARVLAATCHKAADHAAIEGGLFIEYADLPQALQTRILPHFGIVPDAVDAEALAVALTRDAKQPHQSFDPHERPPRAAASPAVIAASDRHLAPAVERLRNSIRAAPIDAATASPSSWVEGGQEHGRMAIRKSTDWLCARAGEEIMMMNAAQGSYIGLNAVGARIWDLLDSEPDADSICARLVEEFAVDEALCSAEVEAFLAELEANKAVTREPAQGA